MSKAMIGRHSLANLFVRWLIFKVKYLQGKLIVDYFLK